MVASLAVLEKIIDLVPIENRSIICDQIVHEITVNKNDFFRSVLKDIAEYREPVLPTGIVIGTPFIGCAIYTVDCMFERGEIEKSYSELFMSEIIWQLQGKSKAERQNLWLQNLVRGTS